MAVHSLFGLHDLSTHAQTTATASLLPRPLSAVSARTKRQPNCRRRHLYCSAVPPAQLPPAHVPVAAAMHWPLEPLATKEPLTLPMTTTTIMMTTTTTTPFLTIDPPGATTSATTYWSRPSNGHTTLPDVFPTESSSDFSTPASTADATQGRSSNQADNIVMIASMVASIGLVVLGVGCYRLHLMRKLDRSRSQPQSQQPEGDPTNYHYQLSHPHTSDQRLFELDPSHSSNSPYLDSIYLTHPPEALHLGPSDPRTPHRHRHQYQVSTLPPPHANTSISSEPIPMQTLERTTALLTQPQGQSLPPNLLLPASPDLRQPTGPFFASGLPLFRPQDRDRAYWSHPESAPPTGSPMPMSSTWSPRPPPFPRGRGRGGVNMGRRRPPRRNSQMDSGLMDDEDLIRIPPPPPYDGHQISNP